MKLTSVEYVKGAPRIEECPKVLLPEVAFVGRSNVGKSSLINLLLQQRMAHVSGTPGKTQLIHFYLINRIFHFVDLPGYGYARAPRSVKEQWGPMVEDYLFQREQLRGIVFLIDLRHPDAELDHKMKEWLDHFQRETLYVATKADKINRGQRKTQIDAVKVSYGISDLIVTSVETREGRDDLWREIERMALGGKRG
ncbi:MAG: YihA family ribosome biogenesis GTP-binding protein [Nitrospirae bacterium]|nr:YihA family ribosome biogenesis GTP-binding protein [Candidatus Manganitrophaceae bacterium]